MLKAYPKKSIIAVMNRRDLLSGKAVKGPSILDVKKWPQWWEEGAKELEKTAPGRILTAPVRIPDAVLTSTTKTVQEVPEVVKSVSRALPLLLIVAAAGGAGYVAYKAGLFKKISKS